MLPKWLSGKESACNAGDTGDWIQSLGWEDPLEKEMSNHSSLLGWKIPQTEEPGGLQSMRSLGVGHNWVTEHTHSWSIFAIICHLWLFGNACLIPRASPVLLVVKNLPASAGDAREVRSIPGSGRSPGGGHGHPVQYSCWRIPWTEEPGGLQSMGL